MAEYSAAIDYLVDSSRVFVGQNSCEVERAGKSNEWYTPARYVEAARKVMGSIDLDPASCEMANQTVKADRYYTIEDDGLTQEWYGRVWLNPPYGKVDNKSYMGMFIDKLIQEYTKGAVTQAITLVTMQTHASWFNWLWNYPVCFTDHNIRFYLPYGSNKVSRPGRMTDCHMYGTCFVYLGPHEANFIEVFEQFGVVAKRVSTPKQKVAPLPLWEVLP